MSTFIKFLIVIISIIVIISVGYFCTLWYIGYGMKKAQKIGIEQDKKEFYQEEIYAKRTSNSDDGCISARNIKTGLPLIDFKVMNIILKKNDTLYKQNNSKHLYKLVSKSKVELNYNFCY